MGCKIVWHLKGIIQYNYLSGLIDIAHYCMTHIGAVILPFVFVAIILDPFNPNFDRSSLIRYLDYLSWWV